MRRPGRSRVGVALRPRLLDLGEHTLAKAGAKPRQGSLDTANVDQVGANAEDQANRVPS
jgi:hypothetical protein